MIDNVFAVNDFKSFQVFDSFEPFGFQFVYVVIVIKRAKNIFVFSFCRGIYFFEIEEYVAYANTVSTDFIGIGGSDTFSCGPDFGASFRSFISRIENSVCG